METARVRTSELARTPATSNGRGGRGRGRGRGRRGSSRNRHRAHASSSHHAPTHSPETASAQPSAHCTMSRSRPTNADDQVQLSELSNTLRDLMLRGQVECIVCLEKIKREKALWSCAICFSITHLYCAKKWARKNHATNTFNCPSCRSPSGDLNKLHFSCYCRRRRDPQLEPGVTPGSCAEPCLRPRGAPRSNCPHLCTALCHPGPCAPCIVPADPVACHCGQSRISRRCGDPVPEHGISCGQICKKPKIPCGHPCPLVCHPGSCGECFVSIPVKCFCGRNLQEVPCSYASNGVSCGQVCDKLLACGNHRCQKICHDGPCDPCSTSPHAVDRCPCGKRHLSAEQRLGRKSCLDKIPSCGQPCGRRLSCLANHTCTKICGHEGDCGPCKEIVQVECRCGTSTLKVLCGDDPSKLREALICDKKCNDRLLCREHRCQQICCRFKKRKARPRPNVISSEALWNDSTDSVQCCEMSNAERRRVGHRCNRQCNKQLSCKLHTCDLPCGHAGNCPPCGILRREPIQCACGCECIPAPVRCGTLPPQCRRKCTVCRPCGHPCPDRCHHGECPPCVELVKVACVGGHGESRFVPCHIAQKGIKCHRACGRSLLCGVHACRRPCHANYPQECEPSKAEGCSQPCGMPRKKCEHSCTALCHPGMLCPETPCRELVDVSCPCGRRKEKSMCLRGGTGGLQEGGDSVQLSCDDECMANMRLRAFATAVGRDGSSTGTGGTIDVDGVAPGVAKYSEFLYRFAETEPGMLLYFEKGFASIVCGRAKKFTLEKLPELHRLVVHTLAELYLLDTESNGQFSSRVLTVRHRGAGVKPVFPTPLLSEAHAQRELEKKRTRQSESGRAFVVHVAGSLKFSATADIEARVKQELRSHSGSYRLVEKTSMSSNLVGILVEFSTSERAALALNMLKSRPGVTIEAATAGSLRSGTNTVETGPSKRTTWQQTERQSWNEGMPFSRPTGGRSGFQVSPAAPAVDDENVPDSWDD